MAAIDQSRALSPEAPSPAWSSFQAIRHSAEQNRACSRRGVNAVPHCSQFLVSAIDRIPRPVI
jgi:hypothetical protein